MTNPSHTSLQTQLDTKPENATLLPGIKPVLELLQNHPERVQCLFIKKGLRTSEVAQMCHICRAANIRFSVIDEQALNKMYKAKHQGIVARLSATAHVSLEDLLTQALAAPLPLILALDHVKDPGNVGTLVRTLYALGGAGLLVPKHNSAYLGDAARKAAAGTLDNIPICTVTNLGHALDTAEEADFALLGTGTLPQSAHTNTLNVFKDPLPLPAILVLGSEDKGLRPSITKRCTSLVHIPFLRHFDSLNVAQAGAIVLSFFAKQRA